MILLYYVSSILVAIYFLFFLFFLLYTRIQKLKYYCKIILYRHVVEQRKRYYIEWEKDKLVLGKLGV